MKLENQVSSLELSKKLKELGVKQESLFYFVDGELSKWVQEYEIMEQFFKNGGEKICSAFTVAELGEMLPKEIERGGELTLLKHDKWHYGYSFLTEESLDMQEWSYKVEAETEADARAKMLIYLIENKLIQICQ